MADVPVQVDFYGMCLFVLSTENKTAEVCLLNTAFTEWQAAPDPASNEFPKDPLLGPAYHHPILAIDASCVRSATLARLPSLKGLIESRPIEQLPALAGWSLSGWNTRIGDGDVRYALDIPAVGHPTSFSNGDWSSLGFVPCLTRINPGCQRKAEVRTGGKQVLSRIQFGGGELTCLQPSEAGFGAHVWSFSPARQQAVTDRVRFTGALRDGRLSLVGEDKAAATIELKPPPDGSPVRLWVSHEAGTRENLVEQWVWQRLNPGQNRKDMMLHFPSFYDAIDGGSYRDLTSPSRQGRFDSSAQIRQETAVCVMASILE
ncbi:MAG: hypothetical protein IT178_10810 [Acidobacteria bacterium]|nr:hypothetical protein [Acidobacteriota bacterium]